jgi:hypothetical protein
VVGKKNRFYMGYLFSGKDPDVGVESPSAEIFSKDTLLFNWDTVWSRFSFKDLREPINNCCEVIKKKVDV